MPYVQRDHNNVVIGIYAQQQPGIAGEFLPDDHIDLIKPHARVISETIISIEMAQPITQRHLRELTITIAVQAGQVDPAMLDIKLPIDEMTPAWLAIPVGVRRCVLQERAIRKERAKL